MPTHVTILLNCRGPLTIISYFEYIINIYVFVISYNVTPDHKYCLLIHHLVAMPLVRHNIMRQADPHHEAHCSTEYSQTARCGPAPQSRQGPLLPPLNSGVSNSSLNYLVLPAHRTWAGRNALRIGTFYTSTPRHFELQWLSCCSRICRTLVEAERSSLNKQ